MGEARLREVARAMGEPEPPWAVHGVKSPGRPKRWQLAVALGFANWVYAAGQRQAAAASGKAAA
jgi:hypothetical protein